MTLITMLERTVAHYGGKTAIVSGDLRLSYADLDYASNKVANALIEMGVKKGDRIAMLLPNSPEFVTTFFGVVKSGAIAVLLDPLYKFPELSALFSDCLPTALVSESPTLEPLIPFLPEFKSIKHVIDVSPNPNRQFLSYREIILNNSAAKTKTSTEPDDIASILYTSAPSFSPRGAMLSHRSLVTEATLMADSFEQTDKDVVILYALPMHHVFGLVGVLLSALAKGSTVVMVPGTGVSISSCMAAIEREKATMFLGVPYIFALAVDLAEKEGIKNDLSSLRFCSSSAAFLPDRIATRFKELYGLKIHDCFGLTEGICYVTRPSLNGVGKAGSVGKTLPGSEVRIEADNGRILPTGQAGEILVRGPIMSGYYNNPQATAEVMKDGWLRTGDIGKIDQDGYLYIVGRKKDVIILKGQNIHPSDIESVLCQHHDVAEAAIIGIPDELRGEIVGAAIRLKAGSNVTEQDLRRLCLERLASYKVPKQFFFLDSLPHTADGKIDKEGVRQRLGIVSTFLHG